jgi:hypothetical protein
MRPLLVILLASGLVCNAQAASLGARLIRATNELGKTDDSLTRIQPKLKKVFGYKSYQQIGLQKTLLKEKDTLRLNLGEGIVLLVTPKATEKRNYTLDVEIYSGKAALVKSTVRIQEGSDVFIKGPEVGSTLLVVALSIVE